LFFLIWKKNFRMSDSKNWFFFSANFQYFFAKISGIGHWVNTINWCWPQVFDRKQSFARGLRNSFSSSSLSLSALLENLLHFWAILKPWKHVQTWSNLIKLDWIGSKWIKLVQTCSNMFKLDQIGSKWNTVVQTWFNWIKLDRNGLNSFRLDSTGSNRIQMD
jgi:hypothetical protein